MKRTLAGAALALALTGCATAAATGSGKLVPGPVQFSTVTLNARPGAVTAYLATHPAPHRPGLTAAVIVSATDWVYCRPAPEHGSDVARGLPCNAWTGVAETRSGRRLHISCGAAYTDHVCPVPWLVWTVGPGAELYVPDAGGAITRNGGAAVIRYDAVNGR